MNLNGLDSNLCRIAVRREALEKMPDDIRVAVLLLGDIGNELNTISQLVLYATRAQDHPVLDRLAVVRGWSLLRIFVRKIDEASERFEKIVFRWPTRDSLAIYIQDEEAAGKVRVLVGGKQSSRIIRRTQALQYCTSEVINAAFAAAGDDEEWSVYTSFDLSDTFYTFANAASIGALAANVGSEIDLVHDRGETLDTLKRDAIEAASAIQRLIWEIITGVLLEYGAVGEVEKALSMDDPRIVDGKTYSIPPLIRGPSNEA